jgi:hypothetical protein
MFIIFLGTAVMLLAFIARTLIRDLSTDGRGRDPLPPRFGWDERDKV